MDWNEFLPLSGHTESFDCIIKRVSIRDRGADLEHAEPWMDNGVCFSGIRVCVCQREKSCGSQQHVVQGAEQAVESALIVY